MIRRDERTVASADLEICIRHCEECSRACLQALSACVEESGGHRPELLRLLKDCAESCRLSASFMRRSSEFYDVIYAAAAEICERCVRACSMRGSDPRLLACAEACARVVNVSRNVGGFLLVRLRERRAVARQTVGA